MQSERGLGDAGAVAVVDHRGEDPQLGGAAADRDPDAQLSPGIGRPVGEEEDLVGREAVVGSLPQIVDSPSPLAGVQPEQFRERAVEREHTVGRLVDPAKRP